MRLINAIQTDITDKIGEFARAVECENIAHTATQVVAKALADLQAEYQDAKSALESFENTVSNDFEKIKGWL